MVGLQSPSRGRDALALQRAQPPRLADAAQPMALGPGQHRALGAAREVEAEGGPVGRLLSGAHPYETFAALIDEELSRAK